MKIIKFGVMILMLFGVSSLGFGFGKGGGGSDASGGGLILFEDARQMLEDYYDKHDYPYVAIVVGYPFLNLEIVFPLKLLEKSVGAVK